MDRRWRLVLFADARRAGVALVIGVLFFLAWDAAGIAAGVFHVGDGPWQSGVRIAPEIPIEEVGFLLLLCHLALVLAAVGERWRARRSVAAARSAAHGAAGERGAS